MTTTTRARVEFNVEIKSPLTYSNNTRKEICNYLKAHTKGISPTTVHQKVRTFS